MKKTLVAAALIVCAVGAFAQYDYDKPKPKQKPLYERLGGVHKIAALIDDFVNRVAGDEAVAGNPKVMEAVKKHGAPALKFQVTAFVCQMTGGPQKYVGKDLVAAHKDLGITEEEWNASAADFIASMDAMNVPKPEQNELLAFVAGTKKDVVNVDPNRKGKSNVPNVKPESLYARLGGVDAIAAVVDEFVNELAQDPVLLSNPNTVKSLQTGKITAAGLKYLVTEQLCQAAGGPQKYSGRKMAVAHKDLGITEKEWESAAKILANVLNKFNVPEREQKELFAIVGSTKKDIVKK